MTVTVTTTRSVITALMAHMATLTTVPAYLSEGPQPPTCPAVIVHPVAGAYGGPLGNPIQDVDVEVQTTSIGTTPDQALWTHDKVAAHLWHATITVSSSPAPVIKTLPVWAVPGSEQPVRRDDTLAEPLFYVTCSWMLRAIPS